MRNDKWNNYHKNIIAIRFEFRFWSFARYPLSQCISELFCLCHFNLAKWFIDPLLTEIPFRLTSNRSIYFIINEQFFESHFFFVSHLTKLKSNKFHFSLTINHRFIYTFFNCSVICFISFYSCDSFVHFPNEYNQLSIKFHLVYVCGSRANLVDS